MYCTGELLWLLIHGLASIFGRGRFSGRALLAGGRSRAPNPRRGGGGAAGWRAARGGLAAAWPAGGEGRVGGGVAGGRRVEEDRGKHELETISWFQL